MAEVMQVFTLERRLFRPDTIPWPSALAKSNQDALRSRYNLAPLAEVMSPGGAVGRIVAQKGEFVADGRAHLVEQFAIEPNTLEAQISADSAVADAFFEDVVEFLRSINSARMPNAAGELTRAYQTTVVAKLSVPFGAMFAEPTERFLQQVAVPRLSRKDAAATVRLAALSWLVSYEAEGMEYALTPRPLTLEPRAGTNPADMVYYTVSPSDYQTHLGILEAFERVMATRRKARGTKRTRTGAKR